MNLAILASSGRQAERLLHKDHEFIREPININVGSDISDSPDAGMAGSAGLRSRFPLAKPLKS
jgi:hypothetical protein